MKAKSGLSLALVPWTGAEALQGGEAPHTGVAALDVDNDRDLDLVLSADGSPLIAVLNDRLGNFHEVVLEDLGTPEPVSGLLVTDLDQDGRPDLVAPSPRVPGAGLAQHHRENDERGDQAHLGNVPDQRARLAIGPGRRPRPRRPPDLLGLPAVHGEPQPGKPLSPLWARNEGKRLSQGELPVGLETSGLDGLALADLVGDPLPDLLIVRGGEAPVVARNLGNGHHWLALQLGGHWRVKPELMRTNSHAIGTRVVVEGQGVHVVYDHTTPESGPGPVDRPGRARPGQA